VQRDLHYAVIDEVDSILIDEARTPLIISGAGEKSTDMYEHGDRFVKTLVFSPTIAPISRIPIRDLPSAIRHLPFDTARPRPPRTAASPRTQDRAFLQARTSGDRHLFTNRPSATGFSPHPTQIESFPPRFQFDPKDQLQTAPPTAAKPSIIPCQNSQRGLPRGWP